ncbi:MAG: 50S ribosomal protein L11 methyltransferase [Rickettsiales bacterium]|nr:50S ribosomal protein L11 methyltransferase [Rickettsiales bacterium]
MIANPFAQPAQIWKMEFHLALSLMPLVEEAFGENALSIGMYEVDADAHYWRLAFYLDHLPDHAQVLARLAILEEVTGLSIEAPIVAPVETRDWVRETQHAFPPFRVGPFYIHGSHVLQQPPVGSTPLLIDANVAFGTGEHATTQGCLLAIEAICRRRLPRRALDMGCGSAILAMALAKRWRVPVLGVEIDAVAVGAAQENLRLNQVNALVDVVVGNGYAAPQVRQHAPFDLIVANILARPLMAMAPQLASMLAPRGHVVLSGLLERQENMVLLAHREHGLRLVRRWRNQGWSALWLTRG